MNRRDFITRAVPATPAGHEITFIREVAQATQVYTTSIKTAASKGKNLSTLYPAAGLNSLADQLKIVAQLISTQVNVRLVQPHQAAIPMISPTKGILLKSI